jgi:inner membrane protein
MTWRTHFMGGIATLWLLPPGLDSSSLALAVVLAVLGALLPDLDARESKLSNVQVAGVTPIKPLAQLLSRSLGHRGPLHSLIALLALSILVSLPLSTLLDPFAGIGLSLGYLSHLLLDACTKSEPGRVHLLPRSLRVVTGGSGEDAAFLLVTLAATSFLLLQLVNPTISTLPISTYEQDFTNSQDL